MTQVDMVKRMPMPVLMEYVDYSFHGSYLKITDNTASYSTVGDS